MDTFSIYGSWRAALDALQNGGPNGLFQRVRAVEVADPLGALYPRNKVSDDATIVLAHAIVDAAEPKTPEERRPLLPYEERVKLGSNLLYRMDRLLRNKGQWPLYTDSKFPVD